MLFNSLKILNYKKGIKISLMSPTVVLSWATRKIDNILFIGYVSEPYTVDYSTGFPVINGLFCERIFGPIISWNCHCGLFNSMDPITLSCYCPLCGGENTDSQIRRYRMGCIQLISSVCHTWYINNNFLSVLLELSKDEIESLIYGGFLDSSLINDIINNIQSSSQYVFIPEYIKYKLSNVNLIDLSVKLRKNLVACTNKVIKSRMYAQHLNVINLFLLNDITPEWLVIDYLPILPAGLRPLLHLYEKSKDNLVLSDINEFYRIILVINNRIKRIRELDNETAVFFELKEKINLQKTFDLLLNCSKNADNDGDDNMLLTRLKSDFFKNYLLGKRVDFSGRSVIVAGPTIPYLKIGLPVRLGLHLFEHKLLNHMKYNSVLQELLYLTYYCGCGNLVLKRLLKYIYSKEFILINRAPTLHRMNLQLFKPSFIEGDAMKLYPLACSGFNADFDGDQMGLFLPISSASRKEAQKMMIHDKNMFHPSVKRNIFKYNQAIVIGLNTLLSLNPNSSNKIIFNSIEDAFNSYYHGLIGVNAVFVLRIVTSNFITQKVCKKYIFTSIGGLLLRNIL